VAGHVGEVRDRPLDLDLEIVDGDVRDHGHRIELALTAHPIGRVVRGLVLDRDEERGDAGQEVAVHVHGVSRLDRRRRWQVDRVVRTANTESRDRSDDDGRGAHC